MTAQFQHPATRRGIKRAVISVADTMLKTVRSYFELGGSSGPLIVPSATNSHQATRPSLNPFVDSGECPVPVRLSAAVRLLFALPLTS
jgi:hypothetical protein